LLEVIEVLQARDAIEFVEHLSVIRTRNPPSSVELERQESTVGVVKFAGI